MKQLFAVALILSASPLAAQQVVSVTSGEHNGFSRLVLQIDPSVDWQVDTRRGMAVIRFPGQALNFATGRVFDKISKDRIAGVSDVQLENGAELQIELECQCEVQSFAFNDNFIVIDVFDGPPLGQATVATSTQQWQPDSLPFIQPPNTPSRFTARIMAEAPRQPQLQPDPPKLEMVAAAPPEPATLAAPQSPDMVAEVEVASGDEAQPFEEDVIAEMDILSGAAVSGMNETVEVEDDPEMLARIEAAQSQLLAQLTRAADQGLVNFVPAPVTVAEVQPEPDPEPALPPEPAPIDPELMQQLSARTAYSQNTEDALTDIVNQFAMPQCLDDADFSMDGWGGDSGFSNQLAALRSGLLGEFDAPDAEIANSIVQLYLRYGLGAEARLSINEMGVTLDNAPIYEDMASLIEGEPARVFGPVLQGAGCGGAHEMWYLATGLGDYQVLEPLSITDIFSSYPIEVRALIGPPLAQAFIRRGPVEAGHVVLEIVRRAEAGVSPAQRMAEAQVMEAEGNFSEAANVYRALALENGEQAPMALISYARVMLAADAGIPETLLVDLETAAFINRNTEFSDSLRLWEIKVRAKVAGADTALAQIESMLAARPDLGVELREMAADIFAQNSADMLGDYPYAQMVLRFADLLDQGPKGDIARLKIAEEIAAIGLPETALDVLAPNLERATPEVLQAEAAAYVQLFQPDQALEVLANDTSLPAYKIRLNAYLQMEDFTAVARLLNEDFAKDISLNDVALRAGDWEKIKDAGAVGTLASYVQGANSPDAMALPAMMADESPTLKAARALLADNEESMRFLEDVLAEGE